MAVAGRKPTPMALKLVTGNPGHRPLPVGEPTPSGRPKPLKPLEGRPLALWKRFISRAWWLTEFDSAKAHLWVHMTAEIEDDPAAVLAARISTWRALGSELGLDPASRARMGGTPPAKKSRAESYFDD